MKTKIYPHITAFWNRADKTENGVSPDFAKTHLDFEKQNKTNDSSWDCSRCSDCSDLKNAKPVEQSEASASWFDVPVIKDIHQAVLAAVEKPGAFDMGDWHKCETTHCRAGWVVHLAGKKGYALEKSSNTIFAAMQIYKASSPIRVSPVRFLGKNEVAMADIKKCAAEEKAAK